MSVSAEVNTLDRLLYESVNGRGQQQFDPTKKTQLRTLTDELVPLYLGRTASIRTGQHVVAAYVKQSKTITEAITPHNYDGIIHNHCDLGVLIRGINESEVEEAEQLSSETGFPFTSIRAAEVLAQAFEAEHVLAETGESVLFIPNQY